MIVLAESVASQVVGISDAITTIEQMFRTLNRGQAEVFPVVMANGPAVGTSFGVKSGILYDAPTLGVKIGSYWPENREVKRAAHASTTLLLDPATGYPKALVAASHLTALRTAASDGVAIKWLSRPESRRLALVGAGHQAWFEVCAACAVRPIDHVAVWNRTPHGAERLASRICKDLGVEAKSSDLQTAIRNADIIITVTAAHEPLVCLDWVKPGVHVSAMGADGRGKQELWLDLITSGRLFADVIEQSVTLGEFQTAFDKGLVNRKDVCSIGSVIDGTAFGRQAEDEITIYDSSGMALQDLTIAELALAKADQLGLTRDVEF